MQAIACRCDPAPTAFWRWPVCSGRDKLKRCLQFRGPTWQADPHLGVKIGEGPGVKFAVVFWLAVFDFQFWFVTIPCAIVLAIVGWYGATWLGGMRWAMFGAAVLLALPFPAAAIAIVIAEIVNSATHWRTLDRDETVAGLQLPAGSRIRFGDKAHSTVSSIDLPHDTDIRGIRPRINDRWLPCRGGAAGPDKDSFIFNKDSIVQRCTLAAAHELFGLELSRGTTMLERGNDNKPWTLMLPPDAAVYIAALATTAPPGITLSAAADGRLEGISSGHGQTIIVRGVPLNSKHFQLQGEQVVSELAEPCLVAGEKRPAGTEVRIDLPSGNVSVSGQS